MKIFKNIINLFIENGIFFVNKIFKILVLFNVLLWWMIVFIFVFNSSLLNIVVRSGLDVIVGIWCNWDFIMDKVIIVNIDEK